MSTIHIITNSQGAGDRLVVYETEAGDVMYDGAVCIGPNRLHYCSVANYRWAIKDHIKVLRENLADLNNGVL